MIEFPKTVTCKWCGQEMENDPGSYYHMKACEADWCLDQIKDAKSEGDDEKLASLRRQLERARYVGD